MITASELSSQISSILYIYHNILVLYFVFIVL